jgi:DNA-binding YbaB/EbfC family protein
MSDELSSSNLKDMRRELERAQQELAEQSVDASAGGGAVKVTMTGTQELLDVQIDSALFEAGDVSMLQDLVLLAVNQVIKDSQLLAARRLGPLAGGAA